MNGEASRARLHQIFALAPVVPVITIEDARLAVPLAQALIAGGPYEFNWGLAIAHQVTVRLVTLDGSSSSSRQLRGSSWFQVQSSTCLTAVQRFKSPKVQSKPGCRQ